MAHARDQRAERAHHPAKHESEPEACRGFGISLLQHEAQAALGRAAVRLHSRCGCGRARRDACSRRRSGRWSCRRGRRGSGRRGTPSRRRLAALEHLLHQIDAAARAVALVAEQHVGRAGGGAEAAMHARSQDRVGARRWSGRRVGCALKFVCMVSRLRSRIHAAGIEDAGRIEGLLELARERRERPGSSGWNTSIAGRTCGSARINVACPPNAAMARRISAAPASVSRRHLEPDQPARPVVDAAARRSCGRCWRRASERWKGAVESRQSGSAVF